MNQDAIQPPEPVEIPSARGPISCALHPVAGGEAAVIMVGGGDGGLDGPAERLYPDLAADLQSAGIASLRLDFRIHKFPGDMDDGVHDVRTALRFLADRYPKFGLLGHSFGGAVVIEAAVQDESVASVATLATQTAGAQRVGEIAPRPILLIHGLADIRLSPDCSRRLYYLAGQPKELVLLAGATHSLRQSREHVRTLLFDWFTKTLRAP